MKSTELTALVVAASLMVGGTYAWQAFGQLAINETVDVTKEAGGRLHDYFDGSNKDVFVENYTPNGTGDDIFARVRLSEYMEYGEDAGDVMSSGGAVKLLRGDIQVDANPDITDVTTWDIYNYGAEAVQGADTIRTFRDLEFAGSTIYLPTFNQNNTDLTPDINGTIEGTSGTGRTDPAESYTDYVSYTDGTSYLGNLVTADDTAGISTNHTAKATGDSTIMTMAEWVEADGPLGEYWVYDTDGWAYWAQPLEPQTATGLLLDEIVVKTNPDEKWYYAVAVLAQLATAGDWGDAEDTSGLTSGMHGDITKDGLGLLNKISGMLKVTNITVTKSNGTPLSGYVFSHAYVNGLDLIAELTIENGTGAAYETAVEWTIAEVSGNSGVILDSTIFDEGSFNPTIDMIGSTYEITVTSLLTPSRTITYTITVIDIPDEIEIATENEVVDVRNTEHLQLYAYEKDTTNEVSVTWSITEASGNSGLTQTQINACLDENGLFTPDASMVGCTYTVKATTPYESIVPATKTISVYDDSVTIKVSSAGNATSMTLSPTEYTLQMSTTITGLLDKSVEWTIVENSGNSGLSQAQINATLDDDGLFTAEDTMVGCSYTITATSKVDGTFYDSMTISINEPTIRVYTDDDTEALENGDTVQYKVEIIGLRDKDVKWSVDEDSDGDRGTIDENGILSISRASGNITVTVTSESRGDLSKDIKLELGYLIPGSTYEELEEIVGTTNTVKSEGIDGADIEYYVLDAKEINEYNSSGVSVSSAEAILLWAKDSVVIGNETIHVFNIMFESVWGGSTMESITLPNWLIEQKYLPNKVIRTMIVTDGYYTTSSQLVGDGSTNEITYNEVFLLSQSEYLSYVGTADIRSNTVNRYWLRSPNGVGGALRFVDVDKNTYSGGNTLKFGVRPALWVVP